MSVHVPRCRRPRPRRARGWAIGVVSLVGAACSLPTPPPAGPAPTPIAAPITVPPDRVAPSEPAPVTPTPAAGPVVCGLDPVVHGPGDDDLRALARRVGLDEPEAFASVVQTVRTTGHLPDCYLTKRTAEGRGWRPGGAVWDAVPGAAIGGDTFGNRERLLPSGLRYQEADLDQGPGRRGADRLVFVPGATGDAARAWVTVDHYDSFTPVLP